MCATAEAVRAQLVDVAKGCGAARSRCSRSVAAARRRSGGRATDAPRSRRSGLSDAFAANLALASHKVAAAPEARE